MITIQYLWIEKWNTIKNAEFNFTAKYSIRFNTETHILTIGDALKSYANSFYGDKLELTAFVGKNGVGKTSLLQFIMAFADGTDHVNERMGRFIVVLEDSDNHSFEIRYHDWDNSLLCKECIVSLEEQGFVVGEIYKPQKTDGLIKTWSREWNYKGRFIYYSESNNNSGVEWYGQSVLTPHRLIWEAQEASYSKNEVLSRYRMAEVERQINFISNMWGNLSDFSINYPEDLYVSIYQSKEEINWKENGDSKEQLQLLNKLFSKYSNSYSMGYLIAKELLISLRSYDFMWEWLEKNEDKTGSSPLAFVKRCFVELQKAENATFLEKWIDFIEYYESSRKSKQFQEHYGDKPGFIVKIKDSTGKANFTVLKRFINRYKEISNIEGFLEFAWRGMSSGEMSLLNLFSRLYSLTKRKNGKNYLPDETYIEKVEENAVVILDEAEVLLHPEWQRLYLKNVLMVIPKMYKGTNIQILLATHSPLILSDILKQNIVFLDGSYDIEKTTSDHRYNHEETFGANIFKLYHDSFYLDSFIGAFAESKITKAIDVIYKEYNNDKPNKKEYREACNVVKLIGDKLVQQEINRMITIIEARKK